MGVSLGKCMRAYHVYRMSGQERMDGGGDTFGFLSYNLISYHLFYRSPVHPAFDTDPMSTQHLCRGTVLTNQNGSVARMFSSHKSLHLRHPTNSSSHIASSILRPPLLLIVIFFSHLFSWSNSVRVSSLGDEYG